MVRFPFKISLPKFKATPNSCLGIDIGTALIKIVHLVKKGGRIKLENYGEISALSLYEKPFRTFEKNVLYLSTPEIAKTIKAVLTEAKIQERKAVFSIPDFSSFFTSFKLPPMTKEELPQAVQFEAPQHIPLPLSEVTIDWQVVGGKTMNKKGSKLEILLVAVPNEVINQYQEIARISNLELQSLEAEVFSLARAAVKDKNLQNIIALVDIGAQSTTCSIIDKGTLKLSHSFDIAGNELTQNLAKSLGVDYEEAEELKRQYGLSSLRERGWPKEASLSSEKSSPQKVASALILAVDSIMVEVKRIFQNFSRLENKEIQKIVLAGGIALVPGLQEYLASSFKKEAEIINPFVDIFYPPVLEEALKEMGPAYAIAVGAALRGLE